MEAELAEVGRRGLRRGKTDRQTGRDWEGEGGQ